MEEPRNISKRGGRASGEGFGKENPVMARFLPPKRPEAGFEIPERKKRLQRRGFSPVSDLANETKVRPARVIDGRNLAVIDRKAISPIRARHLDDKTQATDKELRDDSPIKGKLSESLKPDWEKKRRVTSPTGGKFPFTRNLGVESERRFKSPIRARLPDTEMFGVENETRVNAPIRGRFLEPGVDNKTVADFPIKSGYADNQKFAEGNEQRVNSPIRGRFTDTQKPGVDNECRVDSPSRDRYPDTKKPAVESEPNDDSQIEDPERPAVERLRSSAKFMGPLPSGPDETFEEPAPKPLTRPQRRPEEPQVNYKENFDGKATYLYRSQGKKLSIPKEERPLRLHDPIVKKRKSGTKQNEGQVGDSVLSANSSSDFRKCLTLAQLLEFNRKSTADNNFEERLAKSRAPTLDSSQAAAGAKGQLEEQEEVHKGHELPDPRTRDILRERLEFIGLKDSSEGGSSERNPSCTELGRKESSIYLTTLLAPIENKPVPIPKKWSLVPPAKPADPTRTYEAGKGTEGARNYNNQLPDDDEVSLSVRISRRVVENSRGSVFETVSYSSEKVSGEPSQVSIDYETSFQSTSVKGRFHPYDLRRESHQERSDRKMNEFKKKLQLFRERTAQLKDKPSPIEHKLHTDDIRDASATVKQAAINDFFMKEGEPEKMKVSRTPKENEIKLINSISKSLAFCKNCVRGKTRSKKACLTSLTECQKDILMDYLIKKSNDQPDTPRQPEEKSVEPLIIKPSKTFSFSKQICRRGASKKENVLLTADKQEGTAGDLSTYNILVNNFQPLSDPPHYVKDKSKVSPTTLKKEDTFSSESLKHEAFRDSSPTYYSDEFVNAAKKRRDEKRRNAILRAFGWSKTYAFSNMLHSIRSRDEGKRSSMNCEVFEDANVISSEASICSLLMPMLECSQDLKKETENNVSTNKISSTKGLGDIKQVPTPQVRESTKNNTLSNKHDVKDQPCLTSDTHHPVKKLSAARVENGQAGACSLSPYLTLPASYKKQEFTEAQVTSTKNPNPVSVSDRRLPYPKPTEPITGVSVPNFKTPENISARRRSGELGAESSFMEPPSCTSSELVLEPNDSSFLGDISNLSGLPICEDATHPDKKLLTVFKPKEKNRVTEANDYCALKFNEKLIGLYSEESAANISPESKLAKRFFRRRRINRAKKQFASSKEGTLVTPEIKKDKNTTLKPTNVGKPVDSPLVPTPTKSNDDLTYNLINSNNPNYVGLVADLEKNGNPGRSANSNSPVENNRPIELSVPPTGIPENGPGYSNKGSDDNDLTGAKVKRKAPTSNVNVKRSNFPDSRKRRTSCTELCPDNTTPAGCTPNSSKHRILSELEQVMFPPTCENRSRGPRQIGSSKELWCYEYPTSDETMQQTCPLMANKIGLEFESGREDYLSDGDPKHDFENPPSFYMRNSKSYLDVHGSKCNLLSNTSIIERESLQRELNEGDSLMPEKNLESETSKEPHEDICSPCSNRDLQVDMDDKLLKFRETLLGSIGVTPEKGLNVIETRSNDFVSNDRSFKEKLMLLNRSYQGFANECKNRKCDPSAQELLKWFTMSTNQDFRDNVAMLLLRDFFEREFKRGNSCDNETQVDSFTNVNNLRDLKSKFLFSLSGNDIYETTSAEDAFVARVEGTGGDELSEALAVATLDKLQKLMADESDTQIWRTHQKEILEEAFLSGRFKNPDSCLDVYETDAPGEIFSTQASLLSAVYETCPQGLSSGRKGLLIEDVNPHEYGVFETDIRTFSLESLINKASSQPAQGRFLSQPREPSVYETDTVYATGLAQSADSAMLRALISSYIEFLKKNPIRTEIGTNLPTPLEPK